MFTHFIFRNWNNIREDFAKFREGNPSFLADYLIALGARAIWYARTHVSSDDAQVDGHITPILPRLGGFVVQVRVRDNQQVRAGDTLVVLDDRDYQAKSAT